MGKNTLYVLAALVVFSVIGSGVFLYGSQGQSTSEAGNVASTTSTIAPTATTTESYDVYAETVAEKLIEKETGVSVKAVAAKPTPKNVAGKTWVLSISFNSLNSDLALAESKGETHWMDQVRFDTELTDFENKEKADLPQTTASWEAIIASDDFSQQMIAQVHNTYAPIWQKKLQDLTKIKDAADGVTTIFTSRFGTDISGVPAKYRDAAQYNLDLKSVVADDIHLTEMNLRIKQETIKAVQNKNVEAAVMAANDEDRITVVASWYDERLDTLMKRNDEISQNLQALISEYPR